MSKSELFDLAAEIKGETDKAWRLFDGNLTDRGPDMKQIDKGSQNPRMQCSVCGRWMRLHGKRHEVIGGVVTEVAFQRFYGGCSYNNGDHLAGTGNDVCDSCCHTECMKIKASRSAGTASIFLSAD